MSISIEVVAPSVDAKEHADDTRRKLAEWLTEHANNMHDTVSVLSSADCKVLKAAGQVMFRAAMLHEDVQCPTNFEKPGSRLLRALIDTLHPWSRKTALDHWSMREHTYFMEGAVGEFMKAVFAAGIEQNAEFQHMSADAMLGSDYTSSTRDSVRYSVLGTYGMGTHTVCRSAISGDFWGVSSGFAQEHAEVSALFEPITAAQIQDGWDWEGKPVTLGELPKAVGVPLLYMDVDGPWVAGLLSPKDLIRTRFSRKRLGAWLKDSGVFTDLQIRGFVEHLKASSAGGTFKVYPNDCLFGEVYSGSRAAVSSCMSDDAGAYSTWDDWHPTDAYSAAYHGAGDNGMALFAAYDADGRLRGRGIWRDGGIVRWYGDHALFRPLRKLGIEDDSECLDGSWLAHISDGCGKFIAPYVDGDFQYGQVRGNRVIIGSDGVSLCETNGVVGMDYVYCEDTGDERDRDEAIYQSETNTYRWHEDADWLCPVIREYVDECQRIQIWLDGELVEVVDRVANYGGRYYLVPIDPSGDMLDDDGEVLEEYECDQNYTAAARWR